MPFKPPSLHHHHHHHHHQHREDNQQQHHVGEPATTPTRTPGRPASPSVEHLQSEGTQLEKNISPTLGKDYQQEEIIDNLPTFHQSRKFSVFAKVKEKAKRLKQTLVRRKHGGDTPSWGVSLEDYEADEDPEYLGAPMYESEAAAKEHSPKPYYMTSKEKHNSSNDHPNVVEQKKPINPADPETINQDLQLDDYLELPPPHTERIQPSLVEEENDNIVDHRRGKSGEYTNSLSDTEVVTAEEDQEPKLKRSLSANNRSRTITETVYATISEATYSLTSKVQSLTIRTAPNSPKRHFPEEDEEHNKAVTVVAAAAAAAPAPRSVSAEEDKDHKNNNDVAKQEEEINPNKPAHDHDLDHKGVIEKVRDAVTSLLISENHHHSSSQPQPPPTLARSKSAILSSSSSEIKTQKVPEISSQEVAVAEIQEEENHGRILQAN